MSSLIESRGYEADELHSLLSWLLRDKTLIADEKELFYWYDLLRPQVMKNSHLLLRSLLEDHAAAPTELIQRVVKFLGESQASHESYVAIHLMDDISRCPVDRNVYRAYTMAMHDSGMTRLESAEEWVDQVKGEDAELAHSLQEFRRISLECNESKKVSEENARAMGMIVVQVHRWCKERSYPPLTKDSRERLVKYSDLRLLDHESAMALLWMDLFDYVAPSEAIKERLGLAAKMSAFVSEKRWSSVKVMSLLFGIYTAMDVGILPDFPSKKHQEVIDGVTSSKEIRDRLPIPPFAIDKNTYRGRNCADTTDKIMAILKTGRFLSKEDIHARYNPIEASHGESPHDAKQTALDFKRRVQESESRLSSPAIPKLFEMGEEEDQEGEDSEDSEELIRKLQSPRRRTVTQLALPEPFEETAMSLFAKTSDQLSFLDFESRMSYSGPLTSKEALKALAVSQLAIKWAELETVPEVILRINAKGSKIFMQQPLIGERPAPTEATEELDEVELQQRSLYALTNRKRMEDLTEDGKLDMIKTFMFRRFMGMNCLPLKCLVEGTTGKIYTTDLYTSLKEHQRCRKTVRSGSAYWLFDSSRSRGAIDFVSDLLEGNTSIRREVLKWLEGLLSKNPWKSTIPQSLIPYAIPYQELQENVSAILDAYQPVDLEADSDDEM